MGLLIAIDKFGHRLKFRVFKAGWKRTHAALYHIFNPLCDWRAVEEKRA